MIKSALKVSGLATRYPMVRRISSLIAKYPVDKQKWIPKTGTYPEGFIVGGAYAGVKKHKFEGIKDLAVILSTEPCKTSATFTKNRIKAAPVLLDKSVLSKSADKIQAVLINSGCANAVTGEEGMKNGKRMMKAGDELVAKYISKGTGGSVQSDKTFIMSTGVIGQQLPIEKIEAGVENMQGKLESGHKQWMQVAEAIMTTDTFPKLISKEVTQQGGAKYRMAGVAKGAGMIHPNMATLLGAVFTDVEIPQELLDQAVKRAVEKTFNCISVDGDMSTNDTIVVLSNGLSKAKVSACNTSDGSITAENTEIYQQFEKELTDIMKQLAILVVRDGEGATKFVTISVTGCENDQQAKKVAKSIANSPLVKTAFYGEDANWGRIICAIGGNTEMEIVNEKKINLTISSTDGTSLNLLTDGNPITYSESNEAVAKSILKNQDIFVNIKFSTGLAGSSEFYTCDLSNEYVSINADYRT